jgi:calcineurin-like phosphoesterase family protein
MPKIWLIADTHFGHENIIKYEKRPFASAQAMDSALIKNWNACVSQEDKVFVLGDFSLLPAEATVHTVGSLQGYKILVLGNHDRQHSVAWWQKAGFHEVSAYPIIVDEFFILSHEPVYINENMPYANIFGHVHGNPMYTPCSPQSFCVSVERIGYAPIEFTDVKSRMRGGA